MPTGSVYRYGHLKIPEGYCHGFHDSTTNLSTDVIEIAYVDLIPSCRDGLEQARQYSLGDMYLLSDSNGSPALSYEYALHNGKILNEWNPGSIENLLMQNGETGVPVLPLGTNPGIGDDYLVAPPMKDPLFYLPVQPPFIGIDPTRVAVDLNNPIHRDPSLALASSVWKNYKIKPFDNKPLPCKKGEVLW